MCEWFADRGRVLSEGLYVHGRGSQIQGGCRAGCRLRCRLRLVRRSREGVVRGVVSRVMGEGRRSRGAVGQVSC